MRFLGIAVLAIALLFGSGRPSAAQNPWTFPSGCIGYCGNGIAIGIGVVAGVVATTGILIAVNHGHHFLKGCVSNGPNGLELQTSDSKIYVLEGDPSNVKAGELVRVHGSRHKTGKSFKNNQVFKVDQLKKDYGACQVAPAPAAGPSR